MDFGMCKGSARLHNVRIELYLPGVSIGPMVKKKPRMRSASSVVFWERFLIKTPTPVEPLPDAVNRISV